MSKKYQSRRQLIKNERIKITILSLIFLIVLFGLGLGGFFIGKQNSSNTNAGNTNEDSSLTKSYKLELDSIYNQNFVLNEEITPVAPTVKLNDESLTQTSGEQSDLLRFDLSGVLPSGLEFDNNTGMISGIPNATFYDETQFAITAFYFPDKTKDNCVVKKSNIFSISVLGLEFTNTIDDVVTYYATGTISTTTPQLKFGSDTTNTGVEYFLTEDSDSYIDGLSLNANGVIAGSPNFITAEPFVYQIKAVKTDGGKSYEAYSNKFTIQVLNNENQIMIKGVSNINAYQYDENIGNWIAPELVIGNEVYTSSREGVEIEYKLQQQGEATGTYPSDVVFNNQNGTLSGKVDSVFDGKMLLTVYVTGKYTKQIGTIFSFCVKPNDLALTAFGENGTKVDKDDDKLLVKTEVNGEPIKIGFSATLNGIGVDDLTTLDSLALADGKQMPAGLQYSFFGENKISSFKVWGTPTEHILTGTNKTYNLDFVLLIFKNGYDVTTSCNLEIEISNTINISLPAYYDESEDAYVFTEPGNYAIKLYVNHVEYGKFENESKVEARTPNRTIEWNATSSWLQVNVNSLYITIDSSGFGPNSVEPVESFTIKINYSVGGGNPDLILYAKTFNVKFIYTAPPEPSPPDN